MAFSSSLFLLAAMQIPAPYAVFEAARHSAIRDIHPATIMRVDDAPTIRPYRTDPVAPGLHTIEVSLPGPLVMGSQTKRQQLVIDAQPCTRYFIAAKRSSRTARDWRAYIEGSEPIAECERDLAPPGNT